LKAATGRESLVGPIKARKIPCSTEQCQRWVGASACFRASEQTVGSLPHLVVRPSKVWLQWLQRLRGDPIWSLCSERISNCQRVGQSRQRGQEPLHGIGRNGVAKERMNLSSRLHMFHSTQSCRRAHKTPSAHPQSMQSTTHASLLFFHSVLTRGWYRCSSLVTHGAWPRAGSSSNTPPLMKMP
jgi:hypothetical protein